MLNSKKEIMEFALTINSAIKPKELEILCKYAEAVPEGGTIVEIGSFYGRSTIGILSSIVGTRKRFFAVDRFTAYKEAGKIHPSFFNTFYKNISQINHDNLFTMTTDQEIAAELLHKIKVHMLFIDGPHEYEACKKGYVAFRRLLANDAIVAFHDYKTKYAHTVGVTKFCDEILGTKELEVVEIYETLLVAKNILQMIQRQLFMVQYRSPFIYKYFSVF